nr:CRTAC1 family protein [Chitinophagaceae bacterium]
DGDLDLFVANGCLNPSLMPNPDYYFENINYRFVNKSQEKGVADRGISRGSVVFDYDNDGDLDLLVVNQKPISGNFGEPSRTILYRNDSAMGNWLKVRLNGVDADMNGIGARVRVVAGGLSMIREIDGGSSHLSQNSTIAHFGLGNAAMVDSVIVTWVGGKSQVLLKQKVNQTLNIRENNNKRWYLNKYLLALIFISLTLLAFIFKK